MSYDDDYIGPKHSNHRRYVRSYPSDDYYFYQTPVHHHYVQNTELMSHETYGIHQAATPYWGDSRTPR